MVRAVLFTVWRGSDERSQIAVLSLATGQVSEIGRGHQSSVFAHRSSGVRAQAGRCGPSASTRPARRAGQFRPVQEGVNEGPQAPHSSPSPANGSLVYARRGSPVVGQRTWCGSIARDVKSR